jgi:(p)ppGpp synthase/HD superfamily hydrolase
MINSNLFSYLEYSLKLVNLSRKGSGNMYRHQMETLAILIEYGFTDPVLLKASLIHDLTEEAEKIGFLEIESISSIDEDGAEVLALVKEVSRRSLWGVEEPKSEFLLRIMLHGSEKAKILKLADRISNVGALPLCNNPDFVNDYLRETERYILPYSPQINQFMANELKKLVETISKTIKQ